MDITEIIIAIAIGLMYPLFFDKLIDWVLNYNPHMCDGVGSLANGSEGVLEAIDQCYADKKKKLDSIALKRHIISMIIALGSIFISSMIRPKATKLGVGLGSIRLLMYSLILYWENYNETTKVGILGVSLAFATYLSIRLYTVGSISDIFSLEFGTK